MTMTTIDRLRFYLRDRQAPGKTTFFREDELELLIDDTSSIEEAASVGWLMKAAAAADAPRTKTIGAITESRGSVSEGYSLAMSQHVYWRGRAGVGVARWLEAQPDGDGIVAQLQDVINALSDAGYDYGDTLGAEDLSRLW